MNGTTYFGEYSGPRDLYYLGRTTIATLGIDNFCTIVMVS